MNKSKQKEMFKELVLNATDFMLSAAKELKDSPKFSLLHFCTGVELILKARLMDEHWTLILKDPGKANWRRFVDCTFQTVGMSQAIDRLTGIMPHTLPTRVEKAIKNIANHRNQMVHFYNEDVVHKHAKSLDMISIRKSLRSASKGSVAGKVDTEKPISEATTKRVNAIAEKVMRKTSIQQQIAAEQCRVWHHVYGLVCGPWSSAFSQHSDVLSSIQEAMTENKVYLEESYKELKDQLDHEIESGQRVDECDVCGYRSAIVVDWGLGSCWSTCRVCSAHDVFLEIKCANEDCSGTVKARDGQGECSECKDYYDIDRLLDIVNPPGRRSHKDGHGTDRVFCNTCAGAVGYKQSAVPQGDGTYLCLCCQETFTTLGTCEWCNETYAGELGGETFWLGCAMCDGRGNRD